MGDRSITRPSPPRTTHTEEKRMYIHNPSGIQTPYPSVITYYTTQPLWLAYNLFCPSDVIRMIRSEGTEAGHVRMREVRSAYPILIWKLKEIIAVGRTRRRWETNAEVVTGFIWYRVGPSISLLWTRFMNLWVSYRAVNVLGSQVTTMSASQEGPCSVELVTFSKWREKTGLPSHVGKHTSWTPAFVYCEIVVRWVSIVEYKCNNFDGL